MSEDIVVESAPVAEAPRPARNVSRATARRPNRKPASRTAPARTAADAARTGVAASGVEASVEDRRAPGRDTGEEITRVSRSARSTDRFSIPGNWKRPGWDYEFKTHVVLGQPVDSSNLAEIQEGGWRPVFWRDVPQPWNPGAKPNDQVTRYGQGLYTRPLRLTQEAQREEYAAAEQQKRDRVIGALEGRVAGQEGLADIRGVRPVPIEINVEGEVGVKAQQSRQRG